MVHDVGACKCYSLSINEIKYRIYGESLNSIEKRYKNLILQRQYLTEKISTIEKIMPLLVAYNIWISCGKDCKILINKIRDIIDDLSPYSHSNVIDEINEETKIGVDNLNTGINMLYEQIIKADIKLEESEMTLESLQAINYELKNELNEIKHDST